MKDECCFCGSIKGALVRLYQGWCCISCFKELIGVGGERLSPKAESHKVPASAPHPARSKKTTKNVTNKQFDR